MGMSTGSSKGGYNADMNVTPFIDILLVILIIFFVITPLTQVGYETNLPPKIESAVPPPTTDDQVIVRMDAGGQYFINKEVVPAAAYSARLQEALRGREKKLVFFAADGSLPYEKVAAFLDQTREAGAENLGMVFDDLKPTG